MDSLLRFLIVGSETGAGARAIWLHKASLRGELRGGNVARSLAGCQRLPKLVVRKAPWAGASGFRFDTYQDACLLLRILKSVINQMLVVYAVNLPCQAPMVCVNNRCQF
ncbi:MAG: hypothetical protein HXL68_12315 [Dechloromonas agitata]|uniref:Uncharacterized protein n=1 Tax=Dechloromonas agitata TaxID=73030 RepID=A0A930BXJ1_9RHOO|nr:hypothetical protein [Dechloromonas agitata]